MKILINASNLKQGGALQVTDSICHQLWRYPNHYFVVVLSSKFDMQDISSTDNVIVYQYDIKNNLPTLLLGRDRFLDSLVKDKGIDVVFTVFGPSRWNPRCAHLSGFALSFLVMPESPYYLRMGKKDLLKAKCKNLLWRFFLQRSTHHFYTENEMISQRLARCIKGCNTYTVTNYYNQVFDSPENQVWKNLPEFTGKTFLTIANHYPHKNLEIAIPIAKYLTTRYPDFKFRFVFTIEASEFPKIDESLQDCFLFIGMVRIEECPSLYQQCDVSFQPSLLECFTATYPESMRMGIPIVTTDLKFAHGLCGDAALYYDALSADDAAEKLWRASSEERVIESLREKGFRQLLEYDNYEERTRKLIEICVSLAINKNKI